MRTFLLLEETWNLQMHLKMICLPWANWILLATATLREPEQVVLEEIRPGDKCSQAVLRMFFCPVTLENQRGKVNTSTNIWWVLESLFPGPSICKTCTWLNWSFDGFHSAVWRRDSTPISWTMWKEIDKLWNTFYHSNKSKKYMKYWIGLQ